MLHIGSEAGDAYRALIWGATGQDGELDTVEGSRRERAHHESFVDRIPDDGDARFGTSTTHIRANLVPPWNVGCSGPRMTSPAGPELSARPPMTGRAARS